MIITISKKGGDWMKKSFVLSITLLLAFFTFTIFLFISDTAVNAPHKMDSGAIMVMDESSGEFNWKVDDKKHFFSQIALTIIVFYSQAALLYCSSHRRIRDVKLIFLTPVFYQSNYVVFSPALKN